MEQCSGDVVFATQHSNPYHTVGSSDFFQSSSSLREFFFQDGFLGKSAGDAAMGGTVAPQVRSRNSTDARDGTSVEGCQQPRTILRAVLLFGEA